jgi:hypothetical protein
MKRPRIRLLALLLIGVVAGCAYFQKKDEPPPLPPIEETKPPLTLKGDHFKTFPWEDLPKPAKDGNDPDTFVYSAKDGDTIESVAEKNMGNPALAGGLAAYNELGSPTKISSGQKIIIPYPVIGFSSQIMIKSKGEKEFGRPKPFDSELKEGDEYQLRFEPNVNGYLYVFRQGPKGTALLYPPPPAQPKQKPKGKKPAPPVIAEEIKVRAFEPVIIPGGKNGFRFDPKRAGDRVYIFLCLRKIPELDDLKDKNDIPPQNIQDVMHRVKAGEIHTTDEPNTILKIADPSEILGRALNLRG